MPQIIAFTSPKGGCGATFVCVSVCRMLAEKSHTVLALDMCFDKCTLDFALGFQNEYVYTFSDVIRGDCSFSDAVCRGYGDFLRADYERDLFDYNRAAEILKNSSYEYVLIDVSSVYDEAPNKVAAFADKLVLVTDPAPVSARLCQSISERIGDICDICVVINKIVPYYIRDGIHLTVDEVLDSVGYPLLGLVPWDYAAEFVLANASETMDDYLSLKNPFSNIADRICGERVAACDMEAFFKDGRIYKYLTKGRK